jgi:hypothetical protein
MHCILERLMGENSEQRAVNVYSVVAAKYSAPKYSAPVGDALRSIKAKVRISC